MYLSQIGINMGSEDERRLIEAARTFRRIVHQYNIPQIQIEGVCLKEYEVKAAFKSFVVLGVVKHD